MLGVYYPRTNILFGVLPYVYTVLYEIAVYSRLLSAQPLPHEKTSCVRYCRGWGGEDHVWSEENTVPSSDHPVHGNAVCPLPETRARNVQAHSIVRRTQPVLFLAVSPSTPTPQPQPQPQQSHSRRPAATTAATPEAYRHRAATYARIASFSGKYCASCYWVVPAKNAG